MYCIIPDVEMAVREAARPGIRTGNPMPAPAFRGTVAPLMVEINYIVGLQSREW